MTYGTSKTQFYYSLDNKTFTKLGDQTTLKFSLTVFVGARFGLFCYNTKNGSNGYADFDWFSTESSYDEAKFFPAEFEGYSKDMLSAEKMELAAEEIEVMVGNSKPLKLTATFADGHTEDVAAKVSSIVSKEGVVSLQNGMLRGLEEGSVGMTVIYTDPLGKELRASFNVRSSFFPFGAEYISTSLFSEGTYTERTRIFKFGQYGQMGWEYSNGVDMSGYKYLVLKLKKANNGAHINVFTTSSIWGDCCETPDFGSKKQIVLDLQTAVYTSGNNTGQPLDTKNVRIVSFWCNNGSLVVDDMYLTNNEDYSRSIPDGIESLTPDFSLKGEGSWYDLSGRRISEPQHGLNIIRYSDGSAKKVLVK
jgi:hypothetical protein